MDGGSPEYSRALKGEITSLAKVEMAVDCSFGTRDSKGLILVDGSLLTDSLRLSGRLLSNVEKQSCCRVAFAKRLANLWRKQNGRRCVRSSILYSGEDRTPLTLIMRYGAQHTCVLQPTSALGHHIFTFRSPFQTSANLCRAV